MALVLKDRVKVTSTTTGNGTFTLGSAVSGFQDFSVIGNGNTTYYTIALQGGTEWEVGLGTYTSSGTTLARNTVLASSAAGAKVVFSAGTKDVFTTYPAEIAAFASNPGATAGYALTSNGVGVAPSYQAIPTPSVPSATPTVAGIVFGRTNGAIPCCFASCNTSIGYNAGSSGFGYGSVAVGVNAGLAQSIGSVAIGSNSGNGSQCGSVAIGQNAGGGGGLGQCLFAVAIGKCSGASMQGSASVAVGIFAGRINQGYCATAVGSFAGMYGQGSSAVAIGVGAGSGAFSCCVATQTQGANAIAIGLFAGKYSQGSCSVAIGNGAGSCAQPSNSIVIAACGVGFNATGVCQTHVGPIRAVCSTSGLQSLFYCATTKEVIQGAGGGGGGSPATPTVAGVVFGKTDPAACFGSVSLGNYAGAATGSRTVSIGMAAGMCGQGCNSVSVGACAGSGFQGMGSVAIGACSGYINQGGSCGSAVAVGGGAGKINQGYGTVAIGTSAGYNTQGMSAVAIGAAAAQELQGSWAIAIGCGAAHCNQGSSAIAIGPSAGVVNQGSCSVAIGSFSGFMSQCITAVAIGAEAGRTAQGANAVAIGYKAGRNSQPANSITINATGVALSPSSSCQTHMAPIRNATTAYHLYYDPTTKEITYG